MARRIVYSWSLPNHSGPFNLQFYIGRPVPAKSYVFQAYAIPAEPTPAEISGPLELSWSFSDSLRTPYAYLPKVGAPRSVQLLPLSTSSALTGLTIAVRSWSQDASPPEEIFGSAWAAFRPTPESETRNAYYSKADWKSENE